MQYNLLPRFVCVYVCMCACVHGKFLVQINITNQNTLIEHSNVVLKLGIE